MYQLIKASGLIAALTACFLIVLPTLLVKLNYRSEPISYVVRHSLSGTVFRIGLIITSVFLICNILRLSIELKGTSFGTYIYIIGATCMIFVSLVSIDANERLHTLFTKGYFLCSTLGSFFFSYGMLHEYSISMIIAIIGGVGTMVLYFKLGLKAYSEYWGILFSILWVLSFYIKGGA